MKRLGLIFLLVAFFLAYTPALWATEEGGHEAVATEAVHSAAPQAEVATHEATAHEAGHAAMGMHEEHKVHPHVTKRQLRDLLWWTVNFVILCIILVKYGKRPTVELFQSRREAIENEYKELEEKKAEAEARYKEYEAKLATLEEEAKAIMEAFIEQGKKEKERIIKEAHETAERIKQQAEFYVQQELEKARAALRQEVAELSVKLAEQIIREKITPEDQKRLVQEFIERVVH